MIKRRIRDGNIQGSKIKRQNERESRRKTERKNIETANLVLTC
jgi:hypothetical protein